MSQDTEWFSGCTQNANDCTQKRNTILPLILWAGVVACVLFIAFGLSGCASEPKEVPKSGPRVEVCYLQLLGQTEDGMSVVAQQCVTPAEFTASQK